MSEEEVGIVLDESRDAMDKAVDSFRQALLKVRTGRASTVLLDGVTVDYYGSPTPLKQLANLSAPDPRMLLVSPFDKGTIGDIERAIQSANLGVTPANDGKVIRIQVPPLTEERRKDLVKQVRKAAEDHKVGVREARRDGLAMLKDLENDGSVGKDDRHRAEKKVQDVTDEYVAKIEELTAAKEKDVLEV